MDPMGVVRAVFRSSLRRHWRALVLLGLVTTAAFAFPLAAATGARRTATSWDRLSAVTYAPDGGLSIPVGDVEAVRAAVEARDDVAAVGIFSWMPASPGGASPEDSGIYAGFGPGFGTDVYRSLIVEGRAPNDDDPGEITINRALQDLTGLGVGDRTDLVGPGIEQPAVVVGVHRNPLEIGPNGGAPNTLGTPAFLARWWPAIQDLPGAEFLRPLVALRFEPGADRNAALDELGAEFPESGIVRPGDLDIDVTDGLRAAATAYAVLAAASGLTSLVMIALLASRTIRASSDDGGTLAALGSVGVQRWLAVAAPAAVAIVAGTVLAPVVAAAASPLVRTGVAREADPTGGVWFDGRLLVLGTAALGVVLVLAAVLLAWRVDGRRRRPDRESARRSRVVSVVAGSPAALVGTQVSSRRLARSTVAALAVATAGLLGAVTWAASAQRLTSDFRLQGWTFDAYVEGEGDVDALLSSPEVEGLAGYDRFAVPIGGSDVDIFALTPERGSLHPSLIRGRAPTGPGEVALGPATVRRLDTSLGDTVTLPGIAGPVDLTVVGEAVYPLIGNGGWGETASVDAATGARLTEEPLESGFLVDLAPDADAADLQAIVGDGGTAFDAFSPPAVERLRGAVGIDGALVAFFGVFAFVVLAFGVVTAAHRSAHDYAVVRSLGFRRRQVRAAIGWNTALTVASGVVIGVPLGIALGRAVWEASVRRLGVLDAFTVPGGSLALAGATLVVAAALVSLAAARVPARAVVASALRTE